MSEDKLLRCPHCGSINISRSVGEKGDGTPWPYIECDDCGAATEPDVWNRRSTVSSPTYYVLRRVVGRTTLHCEYLTSEDKWSPLMADAFLYGDKNGLIAEDQKNSTGSEIIPVKLVEVEG